MKENYLLKKSGVVGIVVLFICASFVSSISGYSEDTSQVDIDIEDVCDSQENVLVTCSTFGFPGEPSQEITMSPSDAEFLYDKIKELQIEIARDPLSHLLTTMIYYPQGCHQIHSHHVYIRLGSRTVDREPYLYQVRVLNCFVSHYYDSHSTVVYDMECR